MNRTKKQSQTKSHMIKSPTVMKQLNELERKGTTSNKHLQGSTNEIQPMVTDEGVNQ